MSKFSALPAEEGVAGASNSTGTGAAGARRTLRTSMCCLTEPPQIEQRWLNVLTCQPPVWAQFDCIDMPR